MYTKKPVVRAECRAAIAACATAAPGVSCPGGKKTRRGRGTVGSRLAYDGDAARQLHGDIFDIDQVAIRARRLRLAVDCAVPGCADILGTIDQLSPAVEDKDFIVLVNVQARDIPIVVQAVVVGRERIR